MGDALIINSTPTEIRVALLEGGTPVEIHIERQSERGVVGNIYLGRVVRVLPGMQAAFVDVGLERTAFLYVNDALPQPVPTGSDAAAAAAPAVALAPRGGFRRPPAADIASVVRQGEQIVVQVQKEPLGGKGARLTKHVTLTGRFLVLLPFAAHLGVSHRIESSAERARLRAVLQPLQPPGGGFIARTAAQGIDAEVLQREAHGLCARWQQILAAAGRHPAPRLLHADLDLALRVTRELFAPSLEQVVVDSEADLARLRAFVAAVSPGDERRVTLHAGPAAIFDHFGVEAELERALGRRVWLKSGGTLVIDQAEALTAIDVNSGRFVGKRSLEETTTQINLEAACAIAFQLRLRNIGGIIIIDFIDMAQAHNRERVLAALTTALSRDRARTTVVRMSEIGLVEMTRKRVRESLGQVLTEPCPTCQGRSRVKSAQTVAHEVLRALARQLGDGAAGTVLVNAEPAVAGYLTTQARAAVATLQARHGAWVVPVARAGYHREFYELIRGPSGGP